MSANESFNILFIVLSNILLMVLNNNLLMLEIFISVKE